MSFFSRLKSIGISRKVKVGIALPVVVAMGFLLREITNMGNIEGDKRPAAIAKAEEKANEELVLNLKNESTQSLHALVNQINSFKEEIRLCEDRAIVAHACDKKGNFDGALMNLNMVLRRLQTMEKDASNLGEKQGLPPKSVELIKQALSILEEDNFEFNEDNENASAFTPLNEEIILFSGIVNSPLFCNVKVM